MGMEIGRQGEPHKSIHPHTNTAGTVRALLQCRGGRRACKRGQRRCCLIYGPDWKDICRCMPGNLFLPCPVFKKRACVASDNRSNAMVIHPYHWCVGWSGMKRSTLITVGPLASWLWHGSGGGNQSLRQWLLTVPPSDSSGFTTPDFVKPTR